MSNDGIAIGRVDFEGAVSEVDLQVAAKMTAEVVLLPRCLQVIVELLQTRCGEQLFLGEGQVGVDDGIGLDDLGYFLFLDAAGRVV